MCDATVTDVVDKVAGLVQVLSDLTNANAATAAAAAAANSNTAAAAAAANAKMAADVAAKQQTMTELLAEMVNITATAVANAAGSSTTNNYDLSSPTGEQLATASMKKQPSCWAYKVANPNLKSGVYVTAQSPSTPFSVAAQLRSNPKQSSSAQ